MNNSYPPHMYPGWQQQPGAYYGYPQQGYNYNAGVYPPQNMAPPMGQQVPQQAPSSSFFNFTSSSFVKGAVIGAVTAYVLTNENVQQGAIKAAVKGWAMVQGGVEEMKERFRDAEAELHAANMQD
ncbi:MAG: hypothetical protein MI754_00925 [Chromatiales bacterium]|nr:hypothetical protein [Chromatiales bacterium]